MSVEEIKDLKKSLKALKEWDGIKPSLKEIYEGLPNHKKELFDWLRSGCSIINIVTKGSLEELTDIKDTILLLNKDPRSGRESRSYGYMQWDEEQGFQIEDRKGSGFLVQKEVRKPTVIGEKDFLKASVNFHTPVAATIFHDVDVQVVVLPDPYDSFEDPAVLRTIKDIIVNNDEEWNVVRKCIIIVDTQEGDNDDKRMILSIQKIPIEFRNYSETIMWEHGN